MQDPAAPTGRPTELVGTGVLNVGSLVAAASLVAVPAHLAADEPTWALLPLVEGSRTPEAQMAPGSSRSDEGLLTRPLRVTVHLDDDLPWGVADVVVQETDDGFRQRRWLVACYAEHWNAAATWTAREDPDAAGEIVAHFQDVLSDALQEYSAADDLESLVELDAKLVGALAASKAVETWAEVGTTEHIDLTEIRAAVKADILENRPLGIIRALAFDAASPASDTAAWGRVTRSDGYRAANFTTKDFFRWAFETSGYNERFVRLALKKSAAIGEILDGERASKGKKGSVFPEVLDALRSRGQATLRANPARAFWAQDPAGTTVDESVPARRTLTPFLRKRP